MIKISEKPSPINAPSNPALLVIINEIEGCKNETNMMLKNRLIQKTLKELYVYSMVMVNVMAIIVNVHQFSDKKKDQLNDTPLIGHKDGTPILMKALAYLEQKHDVLFTDVITI